MIDPGRTAFTVALGAAEPSWPHGAGVSSPAERSSPARRHRRAVDSAAGEPVAPEPTHRVDALRRQVDVRIPHEAWNPRRSKVR